MRTVGLRTAAGLGVLALLVVCSARGQGPGGPPQAPVLPQVPGSPQAPAMPEYTGFHSENGHEGIGHHEPESHEVPYHKLSGFFVSGEYLLLKPRRNALDFAVNSPIAPGIVAGTIESVDWETRNGFRFGAGRRHESGWELGVYYTYLHSADQRALTASPGGTLYPTLTNGSFSAVSQASATTSLDYNVYDLDVAKHVDLHDGLHAKFLVGARAAQIEQKFAAVYSGGPGAAVADTVSSPVFFHGAGLSAGGELQWKWSQYFGLYGKARGSLLSGQFRNFLREQDGAVAYANVAEKYYQIVPVAEVGLGVAYEGEHVFFRVGYEFTNWFDMVNSPDFPVPSTPGKPTRRTSDLSLEGLAVQLGLIF